ncbi:MAG: hypothetical protein JNM64_12705 [Chloroflexia bacterium]|nr:hypothetical protein [Chloroflexia bacterium]
MPCGTYCCDVYGLCYIASYPDLILARGIDAAGGQCHFTTGPFGRGKPCGFDVVCDLSRYPHLHAAFGSGAWAATVHHIRYGYSEVRLSIGLPSGLRRAASHLATTSIASAHTSCVKAVALVGHERDVADT